MKHRRLFTGVLFALLVSVLLMPAPLSAEAPAPPRIILFIGDGMGAQHRKAAQWYAVGQNGKLAMDAMPFSGMMGTNNALDEVTDSAAAGTAMATGVKVENRVISVDVNAGNAPLTTILEQAQEQGLAVGLATNTQMSHATPAAFAAHVEDRGAMSEIAAQMIDARVNVLLGGGRSYFEPDLITEAVNAGYTYVQNAAGLNAVDITTTTHLLGLFADGGMPRPHSPTLALMTQTALSILSQDPDGFFLMVEGGQIDWASHANDAANVISDTVGFDAAVSVGKDYAAQTENVLIIVTADHETGGMEASLTDNGGAIFHMPDGSPFYIDWSSTHHTTATVPTTAQGPWSAILAESYENTHLYDVMRTALLNPLSLSIAGPATGTMLIPEDFVAGVNPVTATAPFTYHWSATDLSPITHTGGVSHAMALRWTSPGTKTITVTAQSAETTLLAHQHIFLAEQQLYLPLIFASSTTAN